MRAHFYDDEFLESGTLYGFQVSRYTSATAHPKMKFQTAIPISIVPNPQHQSPEERARDAPRMALLRAIQKKVDENGGTIGCFEELEAIRDEMEKAFKAKKIQKKVPQKEKFPRLVRRNARRGAGASGGTWTEEILM